MNAPRPIVILGPTAGGKSNLAVRLAEQLTRRQGPADACGAITTAEVISADSMQIYRHMDAGTAKPSIALRRRVRHHLIDIVEPAERFTVADWLDRADRLIGDMRKAAILPIIVGGTNLYIRALLEGLFDAPPVDPVLRAQLENVDGQVLYERLGAVDAASAERIHPNDRRRIIRALEVYKQTKKPISHWQTQWREPRSPQQATSDLYRHGPILIGLKWPTEAINQRINLRVKAMFFPTSVEQELVRQLLPNRESLPDEAKRLWSAKLFGPQSIQAIGYKQVIDNICGRCTLEKSFERTKVVTRRFAKMQRTWLRRFCNVHWLGAAGKTEAELTEAAAGIVSSYFD